MTLSRPDADAPDLTAWARRTLAGNDDRPALLRRLAVEDFLPPFDWQEAYEILHGARQQGGAPPALALWQEETRLRADMGAFTSEFFSFDFPTRRARWLSLLKECAGYPPLVAQLAALEPGLGVSPITDRYPQVTELANQAMALFLLAPTDRAARRQELLSQREKEPGKVSWIAVRLRKCYPAIAALEPDLLAQVEAWDIICRQESPPKRAEKRFSAPSGCAVWAALLLLSNLFRLGSHQTSVSTSTYRPTSPQSPPVWSPPTRQPLVRQPWLRQPTPSSSTSPVFSFQPADREQVTRPQRLPNESPLSYQRRLYLWKSLKGKPAKAKQSGQGDATEDPLLPDLPRRP